MMEETVMSKEDTAFLDMLNQQSEIPAEAMVAKAKTFEEVCPVFTRWETAFLKRLKYVTDLLDAFYADGDYDFAPTYVRTKMDSTVRNFESNAAMKDRDFKDLSELHATTSGWLRGYSIGNLVLRIPLIKISNETETHYIQDIYVRFILTAECSIAGTDVRRGKQTASEYEHAYTFSHARSGTGWRDLCYGSTDYDTLRMEAYEKWNPDKIYQYIMRFRDYLSYESLEGGPHIKISKLKTGIGGNARGPQLTPSVQDSMYAAVVHHCKNIALSGSSVNKFMDRVNIIRNQQTWEELSEAVSQVPGHDGFMEIYDGDLQKTVSAATNDLDESRIATYNKQIRDGQNPGHVFSYKGKQVVLEIVKPYGYIDSETKSKRLLSNNVYTRLCDIIDNRLCYFFLTEQEENKQ